jgi:hypothetical protein
MVLHLVAMGSMNGVAIGGTPPVYKKLVAAARFKSSREFSLKLPSSI